MTPTQPTAPAHKPAEFPADRYARQTRNATVIIAVIMLIIVIIAIKAGVDVHHAVNVLNQPASCTTLGTC
jgi:hypothetical protein